MLLDIDTVPLLERVLVEKTDYPKAKELAELTLTRLQAKSSDVNTDLIVAEISIEAWEDMPVGNGNESDVYFRVDVTCTDGQQWTIMKRYLDFTVLEARTHKGRGPMPQFPACVSESSIPEGPGHS